MTGPYYKVPFAYSGDTQAVPEADPGNGSVCYEIGYNPRQELPYTDPNATNIIREQENEIIKGITENLQDFQQVGFYPFITEAMNGGTPFPYSKNAICQFNGRNWQSLIDNNNDQNPEISGLWMLFSSVSIYENRRSLGNMSTRNWTAQTSSDQTANWNSIAWSPQLSVFVAVSDFNDRIMTSADGVTWVDRSAGITLQCRFVIWCEELAIFVVVGKFGGAENVLTSTDGINWTARTAIDNDWRSLCWSPELSLLVAVSSDGANQVMTSPDGITWTVRSASSYESWRSVAWSPYLSLFVAVSETGSGRVMTSPDGIIWTGRTASELNDWQSVTWSDELSIFVAVADTGTNRVMVSSDGINWSSHTSAAQNSWTCVIFCDDLGVLVATSEDGANRIMTSIDGFKWDLKPAVIDSGWQSVCWSPELSLLVCVGDNGPERVMTSL